MPRFTIRQGPILVAYGYENFDQSVFLTVLDSRMASSLEASESVNKVAHTVGNEGGDGVYLALNTAKSGMGMHVDHSTMATYLARYGVSTEQILDLPLKLPDSHPLMKSVLKKKQKQNSSKDSRRGGHGQCAQCKKLSTLVCGKCHVVRYCSRDCQAKNWAIHKVFCRMKTVKSDLDPEKSLQVILLPSDGSPPSFIRIPKEENKYEGEKGDLIDTKKFFSIEGSINSRFFPAAKQAALEGSYQIVYKEDFLVDGFSTPNKCAGKLLLDKKDTKHWRGDILFCKTRVIPRGFLNDIYYEDMTMSDVKDAVEFLQDYTKETYHD